MYQATLRFLRSGGDQPVIARDLNRQLSERGIDRKRGWMSRCSSNLDLLCWPLLLVQLLRRIGVGEPHALCRQRHAVQGGAAGNELQAPLQEIGRASCRERV